MRIWRLLACGLVCLISCTPIDEPRSDAPASLWNEPTKLVTAPLWDDRHELLIDGKYEMWAFSRSGERSNLTKAVPGFGGGGEWSPDQSAIAFTCNNRVDGNRICLLRPDGGWRYLTPSDYLAGDPDWSPDGRRIVFRYAKPPGGRGGLRVVDVATGLISDLPASGALHPDWGRGGIAFVARFRGQPSVVILDVQTGQKRQVVRLEDLSNATPDWSPDGKTLVIVHAKGSLPFLAIARSDGSRVHRLPVQGVNPVWSPDGREILFDRGSVVTVMTRQGQEVRKLGFRGIASDWRALR